MKKIIIILTIFLLTGCWNYHELNDLGIATGIAIDKNDNEYEITVMIANSQKSSSDTTSFKSSNSVFTGTGKTLYEALKDCALSISKQIYISHIEVLIISDELAHDGILDIIDLFFRYPQSRNDFYIVISDNCKAGDLLKITSPLDNISSQNIAKNSKVTDELQGFTYTVKYTDLVRELITEGINPVLPSFKIIGNVEEGNKDENIEMSEPETYVKLGMMGIFKNDKLLKIVTEDESKGINIINDKIKITGIIIDYFDGYVTSEVNDMKTKINIKDNTVNIKVNVDASIEEVTANVDIKNEKTIEDIKNKNIEKIKDLINQAILTAKENKTDIFGFGELYHKTDYKKWKEIKDTWDEEIFPQLEININVDMSLESKGSIHDRIEAR